LRRKRKRHAQRAQAKTRRGLRTAPWEKVRVTRRLQAWCWAEVCMCLVHVGVSGPPCAGGDRSALSSGRSCWKVRVPGLMPTANGGTKCGFSNECSLDVRACTTSLILLACRAHCHPLAMFAQTSSTSCTPLQARTPELDCTPKKSSTHPQHTHVGVQLPATPSSYKCLSAHTTRQGRSNACII